ncbi:MAG: hypothetical protein AB8B50_08080 [Pirellulaceae bacterium]
MNQMPEWTAEKENFVATTSDGKIVYVPQAPKQGVTVFGKLSKAWNVCSVRPVPDHSQFIEEAYVRGADLISMFDQRDSDSFAFSLRHCLLASSHSKVGIETWLSVQTDDLDSEPVLSVSCRSADASYWETMSHDEVLGNSSAEAKVDSNSPAAILCQNSVESGVWLIDQGDQQHCELLSSPAESEQRIELFGHFMEKGVIRRARMRFHLVEGEATQAVIRELYEAFLDSPLPLTA